MKSKLSVALAAGALALSAGIPPFLVAEDVQAQVDPVVNGQDVIEQVTEPQGCFWVPGFGWVCY